MSRVSISSVGEAKDLVLYTYRTNRKNVPVTTSFAPRTGLTMFADGEEVGLRTYPVIASITLLGVIVRALGLILVLPALLVTAWLGVASLPLVLLFAVLLIEGKGNGEVELGGITIRFRKGSFSSIIYALVSIASFLISSLVILNISMFQRFLDVVMQNILLVSVVAVVFVFLRALVSIFTSTADEKPSPAVQPLSYTELSSEEVNKAIDDFNKSLPNGMKPVPNIEDGMRGSSLQHAILGREIDEEFQHRVASMEAVGEETKDLDAVLSTALSYHYDSPLAQSDRRVGLVEE